MLRIISYDHISTQWFLCPTPTKVKFEIKGEADFKRRAGSKVKSLFRYEKSHNIKATLIRYRSSAKYFKTLLNYSIFFDTLKASGNIDFESVYLINTPQSNKLLTIQ